MRAHTQPLSLPNQIRCLLSFGPVFWGMLALPNAVIATPSDGKVISGQAVIQQHSPNHTVIHQHSQKTIVNWDSFNIAPHQTVQFIQPSSASIALNRVTGGSPSTILGNLSANGQIFLVNPHGVFFGPSATVNVAGLVASTLQINDHDFLNNRFTFSRFNAQTNGSVINQGDIYAEGGYVVLAGNYVENKGVIEANLGSIALASAQSVSLDLHGDGLITFAINGQALGHLAGAKNTGTLMAKGGQVIMTADVAANLVSTAVQNSGIIQANSIVEKNGEIYLSGHDADVFNAGQLDVSGNHHVDGGRIEITGQRIALVEHASLNANGQNGGTILIGGDVQGLGSTPTATVTHLGQHTTVTADAIGQGNGGKVVVWADDATRFLGNIRAQGGEIAGNGGFVEVSGKSHLVFHGEVSVKATQGRPGTLLLDPVFIIITAGGPDDLIGTSGNDGLNNVLSFAEEDAGQTSFIDAGLISNILVNGTNVTLQAGLDITIDQAIINTDGGQLLMEARRELFVNQDILLSGSNSVLTLVSDEDANSAPESIFINGNVQLGATNGITLRGGTIKVNGSITNFFGDMSMQSVADVEINGSITGTNGGDLSIDAQREVLINQNITLNAGTLTMNANTDNVGAAESVRIKTGLTLAADTGMNISGDDVVIGDTAGTTTLQTDGGLINLSTAGAIKIFGSVLLDTESNAAGNGGNIILTASNEVSALATNASLTLDTSASGIAGDITLNAAIDDSSGGIRLDDLTLNTSGSTNGTTTVTQSVSIIDDLTINGDADIFANLSTTSGDITFNAGSVIVKNSLNFDRTSGAGNITLSSDFNTLNNSQVLTINAATADVFINNPVGQSVSFLGFDIAGASNITFNAPVTVNGTTLAATNAININQLLFSTQVLLNSFSQLNIAATGEISSNVGLTISDPSVSINLGGSLTAFNGDIDISAPINLIGSSSINAGTGGNGDVIFQNSATINGAQSLSIIGDNITGNTAIGSSTRLFDLTLSTPGTAQFINNINAGTITVSSANLANFNALDTTGSVQITANTTNLNQNITAAGGLAVSGNLNLASPVTLDAGNIDINGGTLSLGAAVTFDTSSSNGSMLFGSIIEGSKDLTLTAGTGSIVISGAVGATTALSSLSINAAGPVTFNATLDTSGNTLVNASSGININEAINIGGSLTLNNAGANNITGTINTAQGFFQTGSGSTALSSDITTQAGNLNFNGALQLSGAPNLTSAGNISLNGEVDGAANLGLFAATGNVITHATIGGTTRLNQLNVTALNFENIGAIHTDALINITASQNIALQNALSTRFNNILLTAQGDVIQDAGLLTAANGGVDITGQNITLNTGVSANANTVNLASAAIKLNAVGNIVVSNLTATGVDGLHIILDPVDILVSGNILASGNVTLTSSNSISVTNLAQIQADADASGTGILSLFADSDGIGGGSIFAETGTLLSGNDVFLSGGNVIVDKVLSLNNNLTIIQTNIVLSDSERLEAIPSQSELLSVINFSSTAFKSAGFDQQQLTEADASTDTTTNEDSEASAVTESDDQQEDLAEQPLIEVSENQAGQSCAP